MTFTNIENNQSQFVEAFQRLNPDEQLAVLWYIYTDIGGHITPEPRANSTGEPIAQGWVDRIKQLSQEEQLQVQRDIVTRKETEFSQQYGSLDSSTKLFFWYRLAQCMEEGAAIQVPSDYQPQGQAERFLNQIQGLDFNDKITLAKSVVAPMGFGSPQKITI